MDTIENLGPLQSIAERLSLLYPDENSLRRVLALAKVNALRVPFDGRAANMGWFAAVEAARQGRLVDLVGVMLEEYPLDPWLVAIYAKVGFVSPARPALAAGGKGSRAGDTKREK